MDLNVAGSDGVDGIKVAQDVFHSRPFKRRIALFSFLKDSD
jgi:hypothetical protein